MREVYEFLKKCGTYFIATEENGQPRVRPFGTVDIYEDRLYIQTGRSKAVSRQISKNPKVELCAVDGGTWLRVSATLVEDDSLAAQSHMLDAYPSLRGMYAPGDGNTQVFWLRNATAVFYSFTAEPRTITF